MTATIKIKNSNTAGAIPTSSDLVQGELAINVTDKTIFTKNASGSVVELGKNYTGFKNRIINGAMMIDQRNAGASVTPTGSAYTVDRWQYQCSVASKMSIQQNAGSVTPPTGFSNYLGFTTASAYTAASGEVFEVAHKVEGFNFADMGWGTANAATVTLSFWMRSSLTGTHSGSLTNSAGTRSYPFTVIVNAANTWEYKSVTIAGDTSGTWVGATNGTGVVLYFDLGSGSTFRGTAGSWAGANYVGATGAVQVVANAGATFYITGVQLEKGSTATSFDYRPYGTELALCQRYYQTTNSAIGSGQNTTTLLMNVPFPVEMRTTPSYTVLTAVTVYDGASNFSMSSVGQGNGVLSSKGCFLYNLPNFTGITAFRPYVLNMSGIPFAFSAEL